MFLLEPPLGAGATVAVLDPLIRASAPLNPAPADDAAPLTLAAADDAAALNPAADDAKGEAGTDPAKGEAGRGASGATINLLQITGLLLRVLPLGISPYAVFEQFFNKG